MDAFPIGEVERPFIAVVGTWDPFSPDCERLLDRLAHEARRRGIGSAAILLDPPPKVHLEGEHAFPLFHNTARRVELIRRCGVDLVLRLAFSRDDLYRTASDFFDTILAVIEVEEFWLRHGQDLGRNVGGSQLAVSLACRRHGIRFEQLPEEVSRHSAAEGRGCLLRGNVAGAVVAAGCRPSFSLPVDRWIQLAWPPGTYEAIDSDDPRQTVQRVGLRPAADRMSILNWPSGVRVLEMVGGSPPVPVHISHASHALDPSVRHRSATRTTTLIQELLRASGSPHRPA